MTDKNSEKVTNQEKDNSNIKISITKEDINNIDKQKENLKKELFVYEYLENLIGKTNFTLTDIFSGSTDVLFLVDNWYGNNDNILTKDELASFKENIKSNPNKIDLISSLYSKISENNKKIIEKDISKLNKKDFIKLSSELLGISISEINNIVISDGKQKNINIVNNEIITKEEAIILLIKILKYKGVISEKEFNDLKIKSSGFKDVSKGAIEFINVAKEKGIIKGIENNKLGTNNVNFDIILTMLVKSNILVSKYDNIVKNTTPKSDFLQPEVPEEFYDFEINKEFNTFKIDNFQEKIDYLGLNNRTIFVGVQEKLDNINLFKEKSNETINKIDNKNCKKLHKLNISNNSVSWSCDLFEDDKFVGSNEGYYLIGNINCNIFQFNSYLDDFLSEEDKNIIENILKEKLNISEKDSNKLKIKTFQKNIGFKETGEYTREFTNVIKKFQKENLLKITGILDEATIKKSKEYGSYSFFDFKLDLKDLELLEKNGLSESDYYSTLKKFLYTESINKTYKLSNIYEMFSDKLESEDKDEKSVINEYMDAFSNLNKIEIWLLYINSFSIDKIKSKDNNFLDVVDIGVNYNLAEGDFIRKNGEILSRISRFIRCTQINELFTGILVNGVFNEGFFSIEDLDILENKIKILKKNNIFFNSSGDIFNSIYNKEVFKNIFKLVIDTPIEDFLLFGNYESDPIKIIEFLSLKGSKEFIKYINSSKEDIYLNIGNNKFPLKINIKNSVINYNSKNFFIGILKMINQENLAIPKAEDLKGWQNIIKKYELNAYEFVNQSKKYDAIFFIESPKRDRNGAFKNYYKLGQGLKTMYPKSDFYHYTTELNNNEKYKDYPKDPNAITDKDTKGLIKDIVNYVFNYKNKYGKEPSILINIGLHGGLDGSSYYNGAFNEDALEDNAKLDKKEFELLASISEGITLNSESCYSGTKLDDDRSKYVSKNIIMGSNKQTGRGGLDCWFDKNDLINKYKGNIILDDIFYKYIDSDIVSKLSANGVIKNSFSYIEILDWNNPLIKEYKIKEKLKNFINPEDKSLFMDLNNDGQVTFNELVFIDVFNDNSDSRPTTYKDKNGKLKWLF